MIIIRHLDYDKVNFIQHVATSSTKQSEFYTPVQSVVNSTSKANDLINKGIINSKQDIPHGVYQSPSDETQVKNEPDTISELGVNLAGLGINVITISEPFTYNRHEINKEFFQEKYKEFIKWFFSYYNDEQQQIFKKQFYEFIDKNEQVVPFALWFYEHIVKREIDFSQINVLENFYKTWKVDDSTIRAIHPPSSLKNFNISKEKSMDTCAFSATGDVYNTTTVIKQNN